MTTLSKPEPNGEIISVNTCQNFDDLSVIISQPTQRNVLNDLPITSNSDYSSKRKIRFDNHVNIMLIPCRKEYIDLGLKSQLWWCGADFQSFKASLYAEGLITSDDSILKYGLLILNALVWFMFLIAAFS